MRDIEREVWTFAETLVAHIGEVSPYDVTQTPLTLARIVALAHECYGDAASPLLDAKLTVH